MKWSGGPVVARATVSGYRQLPNCTVEQLRQAVNGFALYSLSAYWKSLKPRFHALAVYLTDESWLEAPVTASGRSGGSSWLVFENRSAREEWMRAPMVQAEPSFRDPRGPRTAGASLRFEVFRRDSYACQYCGRRAPEFPLHVDHIVPWSKGGCTTLTNLRTACSECNLGKSAGSA